MEFETTIVYNEKKKHIAQVYASPTDSVDYVITICYNHLGKLREVNLYLDNDDIIVE